jgi:mono/diheme cytochrome c family protein
VPPIAAPLPAAKPVAADERADMKLGFPSNLKGDAEKGKAFFLANCAECHGPKGDGQGKRAYFIRPVPRNFLEERSRLTLNRPAIYAATFFGRNGTEMPAWGKVLSEQEIANVSEFVFESFIQPGQAAPAKAK